MYLYFKTSCIKLTLFKNMILLQRIPYFLNLVYKTFKGYNTYFFSQFVLKTTYLLFLFLILMLTRKDYWAIVEKGGKHLTAYLITPRQNMLWKRFHYTNNSFNYKTGWAKVNKMLSLKRNNDPSGQNNLLESHVSSITKLV